MRRVVPLLLLATQLVACKEEAATLIVTTSSVAPEGPPSPPLLNVRVNGQQGFDLAVLPDGVLLTTADRDGAVSARMLDREGVLHGAPIALRKAGDAQVFEVSAASSGTRVGVAWVQSAPDGSTSAFGALGDAATRSFAPPQLLGESVPRSAAAGGFVGMSSSEQGNFYVFRRGPDEPCAGDTTRSCANFGFHEILADSVKPRGLPMAVPAPCARPMAGFVSDGERWHYGLCSQDQGFPQTTHFMRQLSPFFVDVHHSLKGCAPLGATKVGNDDVLFAGECPRGREGVRVAGMGWKERRLDLSQASVDCVAGRPRVRVPGDDALELSLREPRAGLELLLPSRFVPGRSRAVWTGMHVLSATWLAGDVVLRRYRCQGSKLSPS